MGSQKPSTPKGTRDFSPDEMMRRNFIFDTIRSVFKKYGYQPIETPAMERTKTLMGKYGDEGDKLIFKIFPRGDKIKPLISEVSRIMHDSQILAQKPEEAMTLENMGPGIFDFLSVELASRITEEALRYDLTVPFARYVVQHQNEITFPFKRYQIQPVWRADRPQKGRYREFYQCDADVVGSKSLMNEVEIVLMIDEIFSLLGIKVKIHLSNRKVIAGIAEFVGTPNRAIDLAIILDKYDKIGSGIYEEMEKKGFDLNSIQRTREFVAIAEESKKRNDAGDGNFGFKALHELFKDSKIGQEGLLEVETVFNGVIKTNGSNRLSAAELTFDVILARGLNYYTGAIFEVTAESGTLNSSISGGGRYDNLTGVFGLQNIPGVGISFGIDRIFDVLNELNAYPDHVKLAASSRVLFVQVAGNVNEVYENLMLAMKYANELRKVGVPCEVYHEAVALGKQFKYADAKKIPFVAIIGENERKTNTITLKNMQSGEQFAVGFAELLEMIK